MGEKGIRDLAEIIFPDNHFKVGLQHTMQRNSIIAKIGINLLYIRTGYMI